MGSEKASVQQVRELEALVNEVVQRFGAMEQEQLSHFGISRSECTALRMVRSGETAMHDLVAGLGVTKSGATRVVDRLERKELARREWSTRDARVCSVRLTPAGERLIHRIDDDGLERMRTLLGGIGPAAREQVLGALRVLAQAARQKGSG